MQEVLAAKAAGIVPSHISMEKADVQAAMAAVRGSIPAILEDKLEAAPASQARLLLWHA